MNHLLEISIGHYLFISGGLFIMGFLGLLLRKNIFVILMSIELMLCGVNLSFITFGHYLNDVDGAVISLLVILISAIEALVGVLIILAFFKKIMEIDNLSLENMKG